MTATRNAVINELNNKIERFIQLYITSLDRNKDLEEKVKKLQDQIEQMKNETNKLNEEIKVIKVANAIASGNESSEAKTRISQLVREIDKCIALLND